MFCKKRMKSTAIPAVKVDKYYKFRLRQDFKW